ncbi:MAG: N-acetylmuramoyl-L-alanine amidase [Oscillospiraceae bacterium]|nr:N-acetylmuramoyl-L-alanine amidase [Oscillospiraceae bacterium]
MTMSAPTRTRRRRRTPVLPIAALLLLVLALGFVLGRMTAPGGAAQRQDAAAKEPPQMPDWVTVDLLPQNKYSRPGTALTRVNGIVIHYVGNPGTTAQQNRNYFAGLAGTHETSASSHFVIGIDGEIIQCVPLDEVAYCSNSRNNDTISIECCHPGEDGQFTQETYDSLVRLTAFLADYYGLEREDIIRHYDVTGKLCPLYFVEHEDAWAEFKDDVFR